MGTREQLRGLQSAGARAHECAAGTAGRDQVAEDLVERRRLLGDGPAQVMVMLVSACWRG